MLARLLRTTKLGTKKNNYQNCEWKPKFSVNYMLHGLFVTKLVRHSTLFWPNRRVNFSSMATALI